MHSTLVYVWRSLHNLQGLAVYAALIALVFCTTCLLQMPRGPIAWPFVGMLPSIFLHLHCLYDWITYVLLQYAGTFRFSGPWFTNYQGVFTCDPRNVEYVLRENFQNFPKGRAFLAIFNDLLGEGIFNVDHELWRIQRKTASLEFNSRRCRQFTEETVRRLVEENLLAVLANASERNSPIDLQDVLLRYTFDTVCIVGLGVDPGCLSATLPVVPFAKAFETSLEVTMFRFLMPEFCWKTLRALKLGKERELPSALRTIEKFAADVISRRRRELKMGSLGNGTDGEGNRGDLLSCFMEMEDEAGQQLHGDKFLRDIAINFILAGRDTSAVALAWFFWLLSDHPEVEEKILQEMRAVLQKREEDPAAVCKSRSRPAAWTRVELNEMQHLQAAVSEALRLYPSVPIDVKEVAGDDVLPDGMAMRAGERLIYCIYSMGRMESIWGADCGEFKPERWLRDGKFVNESPFRYTVFNAGPRLCLGKDLAYFQMKAAAAAILWRFKVRLVPGHPVAPKLSITLYMKNGLLVTLHPRKPSTL